MATAKIAERVSDDEIDALIPRLPASFGVTTVVGIREELAILQETLRERGGSLFGIGTQMPQGQKEAYKTRIRVLERVLGALELGYTPYSVPKNFWAGRLNPDDWSGLQLVFRAPMPREVLEKYKKAKRTKLFDCFVVASPDETLFREAPSMFCEPVLVGFVGSNMYLYLSHPEGQRANGSSQRTTGLITNGGTGFLIAMWDLEKDRKAAGLDF